MTPQEFVLLMVALVISIGGQFFLKLGALQLGKVNADNVVNHILSIATTPELLVGLCLYGLGAILYILLLTRVNLTVAAPCTALSYIFSVLIGYFVFREVISIERAVGIGLIACGVVLVVWQRSP